jgi:hypothetical protein
VAETGGLAGNLPDMAEVVHLGDFLEEGKVQKSRTMK